MNRKNVTTAIIAILAIAGCARQPQEAELERINVAFQEWVGYGPLYLAQDKGFFKEEGMELVFVDEQLDSARREAFKEGILDCEAGTLDLLVTKRALDTPIVAVLELDMSLGSDGIVATEDIKSIEDLIGKRVAFARDDVGETLISYLFHKEGLSLDNITVVPKRPEEVAQAFLDGEADAAVTWEPQLSKGLQRPGAHILVSTRDHPEIIKDTLNVREDIVRNNPGLVKKLIRGWFKAIRYYKEHPVEASEIISKYYDVTPGQYRRQVAGLRWDGYEEQVKLGEREEWLETFNTISEIKFANGRIPKKPSAEKAIDRTLLEGLYEDSQ